MVKNLLTGLWLPIQNCVQEPIRKNSPGVDYAPETGTDPLISNPILSKLCPFQFLHLNRRNQGSLGFWEIFCFFLSLERILSHSVYLNVVVWGRFFSFMG